MKYKRTLIFLLVVQASVNLVGALGPELSFDSLWYHLPLARMVAERGQWGVVPGGLLYYSGLPRLMEWVNAGLLWGGQRLQMGSPETLPKLLSWVIGILCAQIIYKIGRRFADKTTSLMMVVVWYGSLVVGWQSMVVYTDLARTLLVLWAVWYTLELSVGWAAWWIGLAYSVKILSGLEAVGLGLAGIYLARDWKWGLKYLALVAPWVLVWGWLNLRQGYPWFYPLSSLKIIESHVSWSWRAMIGPMIGDGRYILPELAIMIIAIMKWGRDLGGKWRNGLTIGVLIIAGLGITYRAVANSKFMPVLLGYESRHEFLTKHLNFGYGDWYDTDGWVKENLAAKRYLVVGVHNTYYLPGKSWEHESWAEREGCFPYALVQGEYQVHPEWELIYTVERTKTRVYKNNSCVE